MLEAILQYKKTIIGIIVVLILLASYNVFLAPEEDNTALKREALSPEKAPAAKEILALLVDLRALELSGELFNRPAFKELEDFSLPLEPEPQGRQNPFAPIGVEPAEVPETSGDEQNGG